MKVELVGSAHIFGDHIDTDQIYPGRYLELTEHDEIARYAMAGIDLDFAGQSAAGSIIVAGENFGCGSSREHAVITLKAAGVVAVVASSYARIFYRNAINLGFPVLTSPNARTVMHQGDRLTIHISEGNIANQTTGATIQIDRWSQSVMDIMEKGGIIPLLRDKIAAEKQQKV